jgi:hypothetical protein
MALKVWLASPVLIAAMAVTVSMNMLGKQVKIAVTVLRVL